MGFYKNINDLGKKLKFYYQIQKITKIFYTWQKKVF